MDEALEAIGTAFTSTCCRWWCHLNAREWPDDLPGKPKDFESLPDRNITTGVDKYSALKPVMKKLQEVTPTEERLRWWNSPKFRDRHKEVKS